MASKRHSSSRYTSPPFCGRCSCIATLYVNVFSHLFQGKKGEWRGAWSDGSSQWKTSPLISVSAVPAAAGWASFSAFRHVARVWHSANDGVGVESGLQELRCFVAFYEPLKHSEGGVVESGVDLQRRPQERQ